MAKYVFPAIFTPDDGGYSVSFPDVEGVYTCGDTLEEAYEMAEDALSVMLLDMEECGQAIPATTNPNDVARETDEIVSLVHADTAEYKAKTSSKAVKRTVSLPAWLDLKAEKANMSLSRELQEALKAKLGEG